MERKKYWIPVFVVLDDDYITSISTIAYDFSDAVSQARERDGEECWPLNGRKIKSIKWPPGFN